MFSSLLLWAGIFPFFSLNISVPKRLNYSPAHRRLAVTITSFSWNHQVPFLKQRKFLQTNGSSSLAGELFLLLGESGSTTNVTWAVSFADLLIQKGLGLSIILSYMTVGAGLLGDRKSVV